MTLEENLSEEKRRLQRTEDLGRYMHNHPVAYAVRMSFEPGYALRTGLNVLPRKSPERIKLITAASIGDLCKLAVCGLITYQIACKFIG